jgi:hypothetical protein
MALNDAAVITAGQGYIYRAAPGTAAPTPAELSALDPELFGAQKHVVKVAGSPTSFTLLIGDDETATVALDPAAPPATVQAAIETIVGAGNVKVTGVSPSDASGVTVYFGGALQGTMVDVAEGTYVGGTTPETTITTTAPNGWRNLGHTSRDDMPEFGFDGGDTEVKGTWQKKRLREVATGDPLADSLTVHLEQWDRDSLELYYGEDAANTAGIFGVSGDFNPIECAFLVIVIDGAAKIGFYAAKASVKRDDSINMPVDEFSSLPVKATFLDLPGHRLYDWISEDLFPLPA